MGSSRTITIRDDDDWEITLKQIPREDSRGVRACLFNAVPSETLYLERKEVSRPGLPPALSGLKKEGETTLATPTR